MATFRGVLILLVLAAAIALDLTRSSPTLPSTSARSGVSNNSVNTISFTSLSNETTACKPDGNSSACPTAGTRTPITTISLLTETTAATSTCKPVGNNSECLTADTDTSTQKSMTVSDELSGAEKSVTLKKHQFYSVWAVICFNVLRRLFFGGFPY